MRFYYLILVLFVVSCEPVEQDQIAQIKKVLMDQEYAWNQGDIEAYMTGYLQSDSLRFASGGNVSYGWQAALDRYRKGYPDHATMGKLAFSDIRIKIITSDDALVFGKWELERDSDHPWGLFTLVFNKTNNGWKIIHDHTSISKQ
jgi:ketosteroid isomerase-like protein